MSKKRRVRRRMERTATSVIGRLHKLGNEAKRLTAWRADLVREIGGEESLTVGKREIVEQAVRLKLALDRADLDTTQATLDTSQSTTLRRSLLYTLKLLGVAADRRVNPVKPRSRLSEIREEYATGKRGQRAG